MRSQIDENKKILRAEIEKYCDRPMNYDVAERLSICRGALEALCMGDTEKVKAYIADVDIRSGDIAPLTRRTAEEWVGHMENSDGTTGGHWTMESTEEVRKKSGIACDPLAFWVAMNMMYSDYCKVAEKLGVSTLDFYACMAKAFLDDTDAKPDKLARYYEYIVG